MSKKSNKKLHMICLAVFAVLLCAAVWLLGRITEPKYMSGVLEGAMTQEYYNEENSHDVIFVGDCEVYENFSPVTMWEHNELHPRLGAAAYLAVVLSACRGVRARKPEGRCVQCPVDEV